MNESDKLIQALEEMITLKDDKITFLEKRINSLDIDLKDRIRHHEIMMDEQRFHFKEKVRLLEWTIERNEILIQELGRDEIQS